MSQKMLKYNLRFKGRHPIYVFPQHVVAVEAIEYEHMLNGRMVSVTGAALLLSNGHRLEITASPMIVIEDLAKTLGEV